MIAKLKLAAYVILAALAFWFYREFRSSYSSVGQPAPSPATNTVARRPAKTKPDSTNQTALRPAPEIVTNQSTNELAGTNAVATADTNAAPPPAAAPMPRLKPPRRRRRRPTRPPAIPLLRWLRPPPAQRPPEGTSKETRSGTWARWWAH